MSTQYENHRYIVVNSGKVLIWNHTFEPLTGDEFNSLDIESSHSLQLVSHDRRFVAFAADDDDGRYQWVSIRNLLGEVSDSDFHQLSEAVQLERWYCDHQYCGRCGNPTALCETGDRSRLCKNCGLAVFPRISPCVIGIVTRGSDVLLARGVRHREGLFSTLAGFIEPGENAEQAFTREIEEEVGITVDNIAYVESQAWPFPSQLMLGFEAEYCSGKLRLQEDEIIEAKWFNKDNLPLIPSANTISGRLIRRFVARVSSC